MDLDPIQFGPWIRIRIQEGKNDPHPDPDSLEMLDPQFWLQVNKFLSLLSV